MEVLQQIAAAGLVLLLLASSLWLLRRRGLAGLTLRPNSGPRRLHCLERLPLSPQLSLHLVRVGETELLLASSPSGCVLLERIPRLPENLPR